MATTVEEISGWFDRGVEKGATHMIVACDTFDYGDYPVYVMPDEDVRKRRDEIQQQDMTKVMEVYRLDLSKTMQLKEKAIHTPLSSRFCRKTSRLLEGFSPP